MRIKKIEWRNFSSYGNRIQTLDLSGQNSLFQIVGENGAGKSTISQVITFGLYGKLEGKKLKDIPNRINGNAWVRITLDHQSMDVIIERGLDPNIFRIFLDGKEFDQAGSRSLQDFLVDDILGIPYYVFNNTISLSVNDFKSFLKMSVSDKRAIIDKIFGFHILNQMREILKSELKKLKEGIDTLVGKKSSLELSIKNTQEEMENLLLILETQNNSFDAELEKNLQTFQELKNLHDGKFLEFKNTHSSLVKKANETTSLLYETESQLREIAHKLKLYDSNKCPTCSSSLDSDFHQGIKSSLLDSKSQLEADLAEIKSQKTELDTEKEKAQDTSQKFIEKGTKINSRIQQIKDQIQESTKKSQNNQTESLERILGSFESEKNTVVETLQQTEERQYWMKSIDEILGEKGVKQMAIRTILPSLNSEITNLLAKMNLQHQVVFDEEFNSQIYHMGIEIPVQTLSTGEMKKIDFIVLIAILKLMKMKFNSINLLFLDELFSSVDPDGVHSILSILKSISSDLGLNIFVINHAPMPHEIFDFKLDIVKKNNFSSISLETI
jgi:DNA repair exonuclease SbcCD ATPase subunit